MILLLGPSHLNERQHIQSWGEEHLRLAIDASHVGNNVCVSDVEATEEVLKRAKAVAKVILVGISA